MSTSRYNQRRRRRIRKDRDIEKRRMRRRMGDWKNWGERRPRPNQQYDRDDQSKDKR